MVNDDEHGSRLRILGPLGEIGGRAAALALRPLTDTMGAAGKVGATLERRAVDRVLDSRELERILTSALDSARLQAGLRGALASDGARQLVDSVFDSGFFDQLMERTLTSALDSARAQAALRRALASDGARQLVDSFFDSGLFDQFMERLAASDALWRLIDEIATSPTVTAALSKQGLGFADQVGDLMRDRSRKADHRAERIADRLTRRWSKEAPSDGDGRPE